jgi:hypothetical protein
VLDGMHIISNVHLYSWIWGGTINIIATRSHNYGKSP